MAIYAAVMERLDRSIGDLVSALQQRGVLDNTLLIFLSDNGGTAESGPHGRSVGPGPLGSADSDVFYGTGWATLSNTPFRRHKMHNHEGGISTPLIVHWPSRVKVRGELRRQVGHVIDLLPTCLDVAGVEYPSRFGGKPILPPEGRSLVPAFDNQPIDREAIFWEHQGNAAVRAGDWKLVRFGRSGPWELYDLAKDRTELNDLASQYPDKTAELAARWEAWARRAHVKPYPRDKQKKPAK